MSSPQDQPANTVKKFGKGEREVPHHSQQASKYYPAQDEPKPRKVRKTIRPAKLRSSLQPGTVVILLAGRFRGKRVIVLRHLTQGILLVTGPFKINGVPLRRVNARYVIATSTKVDLSGVDENVLEKVGGEDYFAREKKQKKHGEEAFFKQGDKPEAKKGASGRAEDQRSVDRALLSSLKKEPFLSSYLATTFSLRKGDRPHEMKF